MARKKDYRSIIAAWTLLLALMPIYIVKAVHFHEPGEGVSTHSAQTGHAQDEGSCPICHFFLSPFTEAPVLHVVFFASLVAVLPVIRTVDTVCRNTVSAKLRAPPAFYFSK